MIDTHCHLADRKFEKDLAAVIHRASERGVDRMICIADSIVESNKCLQIAEKFDHIYCSVGVHPHAAKEWREGDRAALKALAQSSSKVSAIGEIGLDYHYHFSPSSVQKDVLREQLTLAQELDLPAIIHCREAIADVAAALDTFPLHRAVLHCCSERWEDVASMVQHGLFLSFTGIVTFPQSDTIRQTIRECPIAQLMLETDAPYLTPVPYRGKRNEPAFVREVAEMVAHLKGISFEELEKKTTENAMKFFRWER